MAYEFQRKNRFLQENGIADFGDFLSEIGIDATDPRIDLLVRAWNAATKSASEYFGCYEGVDHGAEAALTVKELNTTS